jgi:hypothetical protein
LKPGQDAEGLLLAAPLLGTVRHALHEAFADIDPQEGETTWNIAERLYELLKMPWMHPEEH